MAPCEHLRGLGDGVCHLYDVLHKQGDGVCP